MNSNMLRIVEVANGSKFGTAVNWPLKRHLHFGPDEYDVFCNNVAKLAKNDIKCEVVEKPCLEGTALVVTIRNKVELNMFAEMYFPKIFKEGIALAMAQDKAIRYSFVSRLRGAPRPVPNYLTAVAQIARVRSRLKQFGIDA